MRNEDRPRAEVRLKEYPTCQFGRVVLLRPVTLSLLSLGERLSWHSSFVRN
jgi:hypothetical protein